MEEPLRCEICGSTLTRQGELGLSCPRCLLSLASEPDIDTETSAQPDECSQIDDIIPPAPRKKSHCV